MACEKLFIPTRVISVHILSALKRNILDIFLAFTVKRTKHYTLIFKLKLFEHFSFAFNDVTAEDRVFLI